MVQLALHSALSDRASEGRVAVIDSWGIDTPKTKEAKAALGALGLDGKILIVLDREDEAVAKSFRNLQEVHTLVKSELNAYDVLCSDWVVFTRSTLPGVITDTSGGVAGAPITDAVPDPDPDDDQPFTEEPERDWDAPLKDTGDNL
jgi:large subunit ribosomal protein L4